MSGQEAVVAKYLEEAVKSLDLKLSPRQLEQLATHFALLQRWNERINLTSIREPHEIAVRHFAESLFLTKLTTAPPGGLLVDIGSGAGFPGVPLISYQHFGHRRRPRERSRNSDQYSSVNPSSASALPAVHQIQSNFACIRLPQRMITPGIAEVFW